MAEDGGLDAQQRRRRRHEKSKRKNRKLDSLLYDLRWFLAGLVIGLPLMFLLIMAISRN